MSDGIEMMGIEMFDAIRRKKTKNPAKFGSKKDN